MIRCREKFTNYASNYLGSYKYSSNRGASYVESAKYYTNLYPTFPRHRDSCWDESHQGPPFKEGGPLNIWHFASGGNEPTKSLRIDSNPAYGVWYRYDGGFICNWNPIGTLWPANGFSTRGQRNDPNSPQGDHPTWGNISSRGASAWKKYRPGKATADAGVFLGEIREVPRMLMTTAKGFRDAYVSLFGRIPKGKIRKAADHWLNTQFGWLPFLSDLRKFHKTYVKSDEMLMQIVRDNNQWVKRGGSVLSSSSSSVWASSSTTNKSYPDFSGVAAMWKETPNKFGSYTIEVVNSQKVWFEARFKYYIPKIESVTWKKRAIQELYGLSVNPALIWELTPWSWLVDWCSNVGDVFNNLDTGLAQNLTAKYAYVMGTTEERANVNSVCSFWNGTQTHSWTFYLKRLQRVEANPFGFSLTWDMLSPRQWSILSALGITRFPH